MPPSLHPPMRRFLRPSPEHGDVLWNLCSATQSPAQKGLTYIKVFHSCYQNCQRRSLLPESFFYNFSRYLFEFFFVAFSVSVIFSVYFEPFGRTNAIFLIPAAFPESSPISPTLRVVRRRSVVHTNRMAAIEEDFDFQVFWALGGLGASSTPTGEVCTPGAHQPAHTTPPAPSIGGH